MSITHVVAGTDLCLPTVGLLADELAQALSGGEAVRLDLSAVATPDLSVVQLVEAARIAARNAGQDFALAAPVTPPFHALLTRAGFPLASDEDATFWLHGVAAQ